MIEDTTALPHAVPAEKAVLSAMMRRPDWIARGRSEGIDESAFYCYPHRMLYLALRDWQHTLPATENGEIDMVGFISHLSTEANIDAMGGASGIMDVYGYTVTLCGWPTWTEQLREMKARRLAITASQSLASASDSAEAIQCAKTTLEGLQRAVSGQKRSVTAKQAADAFWNRFQADHSAGDIPGDSTGIDQLDAISGGMRPGELWVVGGQTSAGKSVFMLQIAAAMIGRGFPAAVFTLEMMAGEIVGRLVTVLGGVRYGAITQPRTASKHDVGLIQAGIVRVAKASLWIDASAGQTTDSITAEAERIRDGHGGLSLIVVDYLQLIRGGRGRNESREEEIARASGGLKQLAKHLDCPVLSATQLNEAGKTRESRAIAQDSDALLIIEDEGIRVAKMRNGPRGGLLPLILDGEKQRFVLNPNRQD